MTLSRKDTAENKELVYWKILDGRLIEILYVEAYTKTGVHIRDMTVIDV